MIKQKLTILAATLAVAASITSSQAALITGGIGFSGIPTFDTGNPGTATEVTSFAPAGVLITAGSFSVIPFASPVTFATPWFFNSGPISSFWTVSGGGETFVFNLTSSSITFQSAGAGAVTVLGSGTVTGTGLINYQQTAINWKFTSTESDPVTTFSATASTVPEPSTVVAGALLLLPFGISTVRILRKNKNA